MKPATPAAKQVSHILKLHGHQSTSDPLITSPLPVLYSFRRCPYAIRARMAIRYSNIRVELREVKLANKPAALLDASPKATVPILIHPNGSIIEESLDIMIWSLNQCDPEHWQQNQYNETVKTLIDTNDGPFKTDLDHYKYADRHPQHSAAFYRQQGEVFLAQLEQQLSHHTYLVSNTASIADIALFPFIRQFAYVDIHWFDSAPYPQLRNWLNSWLESELFLSIMKKYPCWDTEQPLLIL